MAVRSRLAQLTGPVRPGQIELCPVVESLRVIGNEKKLVIIRFLLERPMRFNELLRMGLDSKTLSRSLKSMEAHGLVNRRVVSTQPFSVQYSLTEKGGELRPVIDSLKVWGSKWLTSNRTEQTISDW
jgi:DNA-binding HxlR family transcriptional regulator